jgi:hypothetical protein
MVKNEIKVYSPVVWAEVLRSYLDDNNRTIYDNEHLFWDGELEDFAQRKASRDYIYFERYKRYVPVEKIKDFGLKEVEETKPQEVYKPVEFTDFQRFKKKLIYNRSMVSKIVTNSFILLYNPDKELWTQWIEKKKDSQKEERKK